MKKISALLLSLALFSGAASAGPITYVEDFDAPFPNWESSWLGANSNLTNYYGVGQGRGNNPDGLWISDGINSGNADILFSNNFGDNITEFSIDVTTWINNLVFKAFDLSNNVIFSTAVTSMYGATSNPGTYQTISFQTNNGLKGFSLIGAGVEGNTSIDNVIAVAGQKATNVNESASLILMLFGVLALFAGRRRTAR